MPRPTGCSRASFLLVAGRARVPTCLYVRPLAIAKDSREVNSGLGAYAWSQLLT